MKIKGSQIRGIIESAVRRILKESEHHSNDKDSTNNKRNTVYTDSQVRTALRQPGINIAAVAETYGPWKDWAEGTARSLLSRFSLGRVDLNDVDIQGLGRHIQGMNIHI